MKFDFESVSVEQGMRVLAEMWERDYPALCTGPILRAHVEGARRRAVEARRREALTPEARAAEDAAREEQERAMSACSTAVPVRVGSLVLR